MNILKTEKQMWRRVLLVLGVFVLLITPYLIYNLYNVQVRDAADLQRRAIAQQTRDSLISPLRGSIYDRNMIELAVSATVETIVISPAEIKNDAEAELVARGLADILEMDYETVLKKTTNKKSYYEIVRRKVEKAVADQVREFKTEHKLQGIKLFEDTKRYYPYSDLLSSVIGFTNYDNEGQYGLELKYENVLKGVVGRVITAKNNKGSAMPFYFEQYNDAKDGMGLLLTVDYSIQEMLEKHLMAAQEDINCAEGALGIVMNVKTGEILAIAQTDDYDLNDPRTIVDQSVLDSINAAPQEQQQQLLLDAMMDQWRNKAIQEPYEPGSVFKIITAAIALEENVANERSTFQCGGVFNINGTTGHCWKTVGHGSQTFAKALQNSCNCAFVDIALRIGASRYYSYFKAFGLTEKTNIDMMGEVKPVEGIHYHTYNYFTNDRLGGTVSLGMYGFGQTFKVTPIQMITAVSAVVNGGYLMQPYVVSGYVDSNNNVVQSFSPTVIRQVISEETSIKMRTFVEEVVSKGTGSNAYVRGYRVGGKTGTSEKRDKSIAEGKQFYIASFLGVAPCDDPRVAVLVLLDEPPAGGLHQGGQIAAPVVGRIMSDILPYLGVKAVYTDAELAKLSVEVPQVTGYTPATSEYMVKAAGFQVEVIGEGSYVTAQFPSAGAKIPASATVLLYCGVEPDRTPIQVPDLTGKTFEQANQMAEKYGLFLEVSGALGTGTDEELTIMRQTPAAGEGLTITKGSVMQVEFYSKDNVGE